MMFLLLAFQSMWKRACSESESHNLRNVTSRSGRLSTRLSLPIYGRRAVLYSTRHVLLPFVSIETGYSQTFASQWASEINGQGFKAPRRAPLLGTMKTDNNLLLTSETANPAARQHALQTADTKQLLQYQYVQIYTQLLVYYRWVQLGFRDYKVNLLSLKSACL